MRYMLHTFRPFETIDAVMRLKGRHNLSRSELDALQLAFNELNEMRIPKPGLTFKIPLPDDAFCSPDLIVEDLPMIEIQVVQPEEQIDQAEEQIDQAEEQVEPSALTDEIHPSVEPEQTFNEYVASLEVSGASETVIIPMSQLVEHAPMPGACLQVFS